MLEKDSIIWAIQFLNKHSDGDLFPKILELEALSDKTELLSDKLCRIDLSQIEMGAHRRFIVPKDEFSFRQATQLDLQDSIILTSIIYQYGALIENRRLPSDIIFSYRFSPNIEQGLYAERNKWNIFWRTAKEKSHKTTTILYCDIVDFYNQLSHHAIGNQLIASGIPNKVTQWIIRLIGSTTAGVSKGIPVGPHPAHLLAEASMIPVDNSLLSQGINFIRYVDDIIVFCKNESDARLILYNIATTLDKQQRLALQRHKTRIYNAEDFISVCADMIADRPISIQEDLVLRLINKYSSGDPYKKIYYGDVSDDDWNSISEEIVSSIIREYLSQQTIQYDKLRWFYRRLTQIGHPGGVDISLCNIDKLTPCFANVCMYLGSVQKIYTEKWINIGEQLLELLRSDIVQSNEYFRLLLFSLFTKNQHINHFPSLAQSYQNSEPFIRREIILSAKQNSAIDWLREQKENYIAMDTWQQMSYIFSIRDLPVDERKFFINQFSYSRPIMDVLSRWAKER